MTLTAQILQMAMLILSTVSANPGLPQWQKDQATSIANMAIQFGQQSLNQSGYNYNNNYCGTYGYPNCNYNYNNYNTYPYNNTYCGTYGYPACNNNYTNPTQLTILGPSNIDTSFMQNGQRYTIMWPAYAYNYNNYNNIASVQLLNSGGGTVFIGTANTNSIAWTAGAISGTYTLQILQGGSIIYSRQVTIQ